ncbi:Na+/H+ antiporter NhaC [Aestuariicella hydrocarbonica]|uniref:Na+/H+ antiporter NhaC n=1 Tax=Pseudomaricurvus hydrocarbonicus TaxID=1470433 RepID=A0A9E5MIV5_9GAMM|nr:Na+/H+ antiporter NhaC [Aestuariicella hydrocarbonica]NHO64089.1 Na+/H+ antiporter NhaC [Aestuariicella hydrocarbonica]
MDSDHKKNDFEAELDIVLHDRPKIPLLAACIPLVFMVAMLSLNVFIFGDDAVSGSNQVILMLSAAVASIVAFFYHTSWKEIEEGICTSLKIAIPAMLILLMVGALSGTWLLSGVIPTMIYYGLHILNASWFLASAVVISAIVAIFTGSSWTTSATIGIALMGIGQVMGIAPGMVAGAIISGAYFGDKMSPLSDTTNLAAASTGTELFTHIRYMMITTMPSIVIALTLFALLGFGAQEPEALASDEIAIVLRENIHISPWLLLVPALVLVMILKKVPALPALFAGVVAGALFALIFQPDLVKSIGVAEGGTEEFAVYRGVMKACFGDIAIVTNNELLDGLLTSGGISGMLGTIWLIMSAMTFGGAMEASGFLQRITQALISKARSVTGLIATTAGTCLFSNATTSDQYLAIVIPGRMFANAYKERGLASQNLSRTLEDTGTVTSVLVPWNTCGAYHATVLGVATLSYAPFALFCLISPFMTLVMAATGYRQVKLTS